MRVAFLLTPIIWHVERLGEYQKYVYLNPFYNYLALCRDGLLKGGAGMIEIAVASGLSIVLLILGFIVLAKFKIKIRERAFSI